MGFFLLLLGFLIVVYAVPVCLAIAAVALARTGRGGRFGPAACYVAGIAIIVGGAMTIAVLQSAPPNYSDGFKTVWPGAAALAIAAPFAFRRRGDPTTP